MSGEVLAGAGKKGRKFLQNYFAEGQRAWGRAEKSKKSLNIAGTSTEVHFLLQQFLNFSGPFEILGGSRFTPHWSDQESLTMYSVPPIPRFVTNLNPSVARDRGARYLNCTFNLSTILQVINKSLSQLADPIRAVS